jgi:hypothetical protein
MTVPSVSLCDQGSRRALANEWVAHRGSCRSTAKLEGNGEEKADMSQRRRASLWRLKSTSLGLLLTGLTLVTVSWHIPQNLQGWQTARTPNAAVLAPNNASLQVSSSSSWRERVHYYPLQPSLASKVTSTTRNNDTTWSTAWNFCRRDHLTVRTTTAMPQTNNESFPIHYQCTGPQYEHFTTDVEAYVQDLVDRGHRSPVWGHRPTPLPANATVLIMGNSHSRQIAVALACQGDNLQAMRVVHYSEAFDQAMLTQFVFTNNATLWVMANSYMVYSPQWQRLLEEQMGISLAQVDAVLLGLMNTDPKFLRMMERAMRKDGRQTNDNVVDQLDPQAEYGPTVAAVAQALPSTTALLFLTMWTPDAQSWRTAQAMHQIERLSQESNRTGLTAAWRAHQYVHSMGQECGAIEKGVLGDCVPDGSVDRMRYMHRCTGARGGHSDLVAWDMAEFIARAVRSR